MIMVLVIVGGIEEPAVLWGRAPVEVRVRIDDRDRGALRLKNLPYEYLTVVDTFGLSKGSHRVALTLSTFDDNQRLSCVDGYVLGR